MKLELQTNLANELGHHLAIETGNIIDNQVSSANWMIKKQAQRQDASYKKVFHNYAFDKLMFPACRVRPGLEDHEDL